MPEQDCPEVSTVPSLEKEEAKPDLRAGVFNALSWVRDLAFSVLIAVVSIVFIYQPVKVEGTSMMPGLSDQERIFINKFTYRFGLGNIERGDTVVFEFPGDTSKSYIKRIIGLPGDTIRIDRGQVYVNGQPLQEDYVETDYRDEVSRPEKVVPLDEYYVLGDHRNQSSDSRMWGFVPRRYIYGKAVFCYYPWAKIGRLR
ncbi:MAG TPA: signal peptidase I [Bryobacteraceae bacterium]|jgi:signal peptidase I|nr:signal peptidase I [Bryobacteraceae bacterium]